MGNHWADRIGWKITIPVQIADVSIIICLPNISDQITLGKLNMEVCLGRAQMAKNNQWPFVSTSAVSIQFILSEKLRSRCPRLISESRPQTFGIKRWYFVVQQLGYFVPYKLQ